MEGDASRVLKPLGPGIVLALLSILFGFLLGGAFGAVEDRIKGHLASSGEAVLATAYAGDTAKMDKVVSKSWSYMKRAHLHGGAIGTAALASILLLAMIGRVGALERATAIAFGAGALIYASYWLCAGLKAPGLGSTHDAKEALSFMAIPGAALCILGLLGTLFAVIRGVMLRPGDS